MSWDELVTTALLGTGRRPVPAGLPAPVQALVAAQDDAALAVLDAAAGCTAYQHAGRRPASCPEPPVAPRQALDLAPEAAQRLLDRLLRAHDVPLVDAWLRSCAAAGLGARSGSWLGLAHAAVPERGADRRLVCDVLGERGRAFLGLRPMWRQVLAAAAADPRPLERWDEETGQEALRRLTSGTLTAAQARPLAAALGQHGPFAVVDELRHLAELEHEAGQRWGFAEAAGTLSTRMDIAAAFEETP